MDTWNPFWEFSTTLNQDLLIDGNDVKLYTKLNFVGIEFLTAPINASEMTHFNIDIWTPDPTDPPAAFNILLVDLGPDGTIGGEDNSSHEVSVTSPTLKTGEWVTISIPLSDFVGLSSRAQLGQLVLSGDPNTVYVDNVYFSNDGSGGGSGGTTTPTESAPTPTADAADVISVFSDAYTNLDGTNLNPDWGQGTATSEVSISGNNTLQMMGLDYQGIELAGSQDVSSMENLHIDVYTANSTAFNVFLISNGPVENSYAVSVPTSGWSSIDIPLSSFSPVDLADLIQFKFEGNGDVYIDNIYFYKSGGGGNPTEPTVAAPTPTQNESDVISFFSDAYTDITVDSWRTEWSSAVLEDVTIAGNAAKKYSALDFVGIITEASTVDASGMTHMHIDVWSADFTFFGIKLVDFGANGVYDGGGDDVEHQFDITTPNQGEWVSLDIPLSDFTNLTTREHLAQYILVGQPTGATTVYIDNFFFYK